MKRLMQLGILIVIGLAAVCGNAVSQEGMPPMGPPPEMKEMDDFIGTWDVDMTFYMDTVAMKSTGTAVFSKILGGAAVKMDFSSKYMNMPFDGLMLQTYDRELKEWQSIWVDNMGARMSFYTGTVDGDKSVMQGEDRYMGKVMQSRITTYNNTPQSFDWKMEMSADGGKTWNTGGVAKYTKKK